MAGKKTYGAKRSIGGTVIAAVLALVLVSGVIALAVLLSKDGEVKSENVTAAEATAEHVAKIAEIRKTNPQEDGKYPATLKDIPAVIPDYHTVTYTNDNEKGFCVVVEDKENKIRVTFDSEAGGLNKTGGACKS